MKNSSLYVISFTLYSLTLPCLANLNSKSMVMNQIVELNLVGNYRNRAPELCIVPKHIPGAKYKEKDTQDELELCKFNIGVNAAACPKTNSTNPGINFYTPPSGMSVEDLTRSACLGKNRNGEEAKKVAKYKVSISCSYTPSIVGYYHVSRALGNIANVPPAVIRTLDLYRHYDLIDWGLRLLERKSDGALFNWLEKLKTELERGSGGGNHGDLFTANYDQTYGGFQKNPQGEHQYKEFSKDDHETEEDFRDSNSIYLRLTQPTLRIENDFNQKNVQDFRQLKDAADFILIDTIMNQQDRIGNISYKEKFYYFQGRTLFQKSKLEEVPTEFQAGALKIKELMLKDNDCGVIMEPRIKNARLLDRISHIDPSTYRSLLDFDRALSSETTREVFLRGLQFSERDLKSITANTHEATNLLKSRCNSGKLALDLDLQIHFSRTIPPLFTECE